MKQKILFILLSCCVISCSRQKDLDSLFQKVKYDKSVIKDLDKYKLLNDIVIKNIDTIFKFRYHKRYIASENGKESWQQSDEDSYTFIFNHDENIHESIDGKNLPKFLLASIEKTVASIAKKNLLGFNVSRNGRFEIIIRNTYNKKTHSDIRERLIWNKKSIEHFDNNSLMKDSLVSKNCRYFIWVDTRGF
ncbi:hypothetical protein [Pedobacter paludis]|uniref:Uncharacterized protein n=1 Tax=Pedobacter paludis TaxID=2203212 RepID=A0A317EWX3_9SPHI|nr:hypothetical protein [Pedobacter paludis]PWS31314.1 hypothetical protein DF947_11965 [Pedobacter paludis]